jgi:hypothetical protein
MKGVGLGLAAVVAGTVAMANSAGNAFNDLANYTGDLEDMRAQTGLTITTLMEWQRAFELAGVPISDASKMVSKFQASMEEARKGATPFRDALNEIGLYMPDFEGMGADDALKMVGQRITELSKSGKSIGSLSSIMQDLMGVKMGPGLLRLFSDVSVFDKAKTDVADLAAEVEKNAAFLGQIQDETTRTFYDRRLAQMKTIPAAMSAFGTDGAAIGEGLRSMERFTTIAAEAAAIKAALQLGGLMNPKNFSMEGLTPKNLLDGIKSIFTGGSATTQNQTSKAELETLRAIEKNTKQPTIGVMAP